MNKMVIEQKIKDASNIRVLSSLVFVANLFVFIFLITFYVNYGNTTNGVSNTSYIVPLVFLIIFAAVWLVLWILSIIKLYFYEFEKERNRKLRLIFATLMVFSSFIASILSIIWANKEIEHLNSLKYGQNPSSSYRKPNKEEIDDLNNDENDSINEADMTNPKTKEVKKSNN